MKNKLTKAALVLTFLCAPVTIIADEYNSLFAVEGSYSTIDVETSGATNVDVQTNGFGGIGLKLGAESKNYRIFLSGRYFDAKDFSKLTTMGGEFQYKFNFSKPVNFFLGGNVGYAYMKVGADPIHNLPSVDTTSIYYGADAGFNYHMNELVDLELGARFMTFDESLTRDGVNFDFSSFVTGYASVIIKWQMDDLY